MKKSLLDLLVKHLKLPSNLKVMTRLQVVTEHDQGQSYAQAQLNQVVILTL